VRVAVVGGKLQGIEATYLAHKAGWEVILLDKNSIVPAAGLSDAFYQLDVTTEDLPGIIKTVNLIIPALEDVVALNCLKEKAAKEDIPLAYDARAYAVSSSKKKSNLLFSELDIPMPKPWPKCNLPLIIKPSDLSGSKGIRKINKMEDFITFVTEANFRINKWVIQEFLEGPSYSLEVFGFKGNFAVLQVTEIEVDTHYDCKRVRAPVKLSQKMNKEFKEIAITIAEALNLKGIMDIEVILHNDTLKVLEIDARLPSQTPTVVYKSTGINMLEFLYDIFVRGAIPTIPDIIYKKEVIYEHIKVSPGILEVLGEHIMANAGPLKVYEHFFGADEALTDFVPGCPEWVATLIITADTHKGVWDRRCKVIENIKDHFGLSSCVDASVSNNEAVLEFTSKKVERDDTFIQ